MEFTVEPAIFGAFPGLHLPVAVAHGVDNTGEVPAIEAAWKEVWRRAGAEGKPFGNAQSHPRIRPWRERMRLIGVGKEFPSSAEALLRRAMKGEDPFRINPLVDLYNTISLRHTVPAGGFDLADLSAPLELRLTRPGDTFLALDADEPLAVPSGEVAYASGSTILTRHFVWRQSRAGLITPETRSLFLVSEVLGEVGTEVAAAVREELRRGLAQQFGVEAQSFMADAGQPAISWD